MFATDKFLRAAHYALRTLPPLVLTLLFGVPAVAQTTAPTFREVFQEGQSALAGGDTAKYVMYMVEAHGLLEEGHLNTPFVQYHIARGHAMLGDDEQVVVWLQRMLDEQIEGLMIVYTAFDPAFDGVRRSEEFQALLIQARETEIVATPLRGSLWLLEGAGSCIVASIGPDGVLLVDTGYSLATSGIRQVLQDIGSSDIRYVINTHFHEDHVGGNTNLGYAATIIAHPNTRASLQEDQTFIDGVVIPMRREPALPDLLAAESIQLHVNGETVSVIPLPGHTTGDVVVYFSEARVVHMGDRFFPTASELIYPSRAVDKYLATMDSLMALLPDDALVVTGHSPVVSIQELREAHNATAAMIEFIRTGREAGKSAGQLESEAEERGYPVRWVEGIYGALDEE
jgi:cyclase